MKKRDSDWIVVDWAEFKRCKEHPNEKVYSRGELRMWQLESGEWVADDGKFHSGQCETAQDAFRKYKANLRDEREGVIFLHEDRKIVTDGVKTLEHDLRRESWELRGPFGTVFGYDRERVLRAYGMLEGD
jgi:hypothetical protein